MLHVFSTSGGVEDKRVHSSEDLLLQEANDQLPDTTEHSAEIQVSKLYQYFCICDDTLGHKYYILPHLVCSLLSLEAFD